MSIDFDEEKDRINVAKHGISLARAADFVILRFIEDDRYAYGEVRYRAWGHIGGVPHALAFTVRDGRVRAISLRRAHQKEIRRYAADRGSQ